MPNQEPTPQSQRDLIELEVKRAIAGEVEAYRKTIEGYQAYIERTTNWFTKGVGLVAIAATGMFYFFFGHSIPEAVKTSVSELEVVATARYQLTNQLSIFTQNQISSATNQISSAAIKYIDELKQTTLRSEVEEAVAHFPVQSLTNLIRSLAPGTVVAYGGEDIRPESGWLRCDGSAVQRAQYGNLFMAIGTTWGAGNGSNTFNLPDLRGMFLRGVNGGRNDQFADPEAESRTNNPANGGNKGNNVGSIQPQAFQSHSHDIKHTTPDDKPWNINAHADQTMNNNGVGGTHGGPLGVTMAAGGSETRPNNAYVYYIIKY